MRYLLPALPALLVAGAVSILAMIWLNQISASVRALTGNLAAEHVLAKEITNQILVIHIAADKYIHAPGQANRDGYAAATTEAAALLARASAISTDPARLAKLTSIQGALRQYDATFSRIVALIEERQALKSQGLDVQEWLIENELTALRIHVISQGDPNIYLALGNAQNAFQLMRLNTVKYLIAGDERYLVLAGFGIQQARPCRLSKRACKIRLSGKTRPKHGQRWPRSNKSCKPSAPATLN